jgi:hypothetical protein
MYPPADFHRLFVQLQTRFPGSSLVAELVQIHAAVFVVKATVVMGSTVLASSMAGAESVELAEDQARLRVLNVLGIVPTASLDLTKDLTNLSAFADRTPPQHQESLKAGSLKAGGIAEITAPPDPAIATKLSLEEVAQLPGIVKGIKLKVGSTSRVEENYQFSSPQGSPEAFLASSSDEPEADYGGFSTDYGEVAQPTTLYEPNVTTTTAATAVAESFEQPLDTTLKPSLSKNGKANKNDEKKNDEKKAIAPSISAHADLDAPSDEPDDLSSLIALTDVEMDRIGWTKSEGRDYLKQTYGKATRQRLELDELLDFLNYLRALPSPYGL